MFLDYVFLCFHPNFILTLWRLHLFIFLTLMSVLYDDVQMDHQTARDTKVLKCMRSLSRYL